MVSNTQSENENENPKMKRIGRKVGNLVAAMLGVSITLVVVLCILMFSPILLTMSSTTSGSPRVPAPSA